MKAGLFITCLADVMRPQIAAAAVHLMRAVGAEVICPHAQTCCGQIAFNAGAFSDAADLAITAAALFDECDKVVFPSASCCGFFRKHWQEVLHHDENSKSNNIKNIASQQKAKLESFASKCMELSEFLQMMNYTPHITNAMSQTPVTYHDCCAGLRELGIKNAPRELLKQSGINIIEMKDCEECCGFGGAFSVKFDGISAAMADRKCDNIQNSGTHTVLMGDLGCIMHLDGRLRKRQQNIRVLHWAEMLAEASGISSEIKESQVT